MPNLNDYINDCPNLCTRTDCERLEARITELERIIEDHLKKPIPEAHDYQLDINVDVLCPNEVSDLYGVGPGAIGVAVKINEIEARDWCFVGDVGNTEINIDLPDFPELPDFNLFCLKSDCETLDQRITQVKIDLENHKSEPVPGGHKWEGEVQVDVSVAASVLGEIRFFTRVDVAGSSDNDQETIYLNFPQFDPTELEEKIRETQETVEVRDTARREENQATSDRISELEDKVTHQQTVITGGGSGSDRISTLEDKVREVEENIAGGSSLDLPVKVELIYNAPVLTVNVKVGSNGDFDTVELFSPQEAQYIRETVESINQSITNILIPSAQAIETNQHTIAQAPFFGQEQLDEINEKIKELICDPQETVNAIKNDPETVKKQDLEDLLNELDLSLLERIWQVLGGDQLWGNDSGFIYNPDNQIRNSASLIFEQERPLTSEVTAFNFYDIIKHFVACDYWRNGNSDWGTDYKLPIDLTLTIEKEEELGEDIFDYIENRGEFERWQFLQLESMLGKFPIEMLIKKDHPLMTRTIVREDSYFDPPNKLTWKIWQYITQGEFREKYFVEKVPVFDEDKKIEVGNIAEALAEIMGMLINSQTQDLYTNEFVARLMAEVSAMRKVGIESFYKIESIEGYLGYPVEETGETYWSTFNPSAENEDPEDILTPTELNFNRTLFSGGTGTLENKLRFLMFVGNIIKAMGWEALDLNDIQGSLTKYVKEKVGLAEEFSDDQQKEWNKFIDNVEEGFPGPYTHDGTQPYGKPRENRPRLRIGTYEEGVGDLWA